MNPWLEQPGLWEEFHSSLLPVMGEYLNKVLYPRYRAGVEKRVYLVRPTEAEAIGQLDIGILPSPASTTPLMTTGATVVAAPVFVELPEEEVTELFLEIRKPHSAEVVTAIEVLSPANKRPGEGRLAYERKRHAILRSQTHFLELDLLRGTEPRFFYPKRHLRPHDYGILISRVPERPSGRLYPFRLREAIPLFNVPLLPGDEEPVLDLNPIIREVYQRASFDLAIDYTRPPLPPLASEDAAWAKQLLNPPPQSPVSNL